MELIEEFNNAVTESKNLTKRPTNEEMLELYSLFKQGSEGDVSGERPGGFDFKAIAKFDAWSARKGLSKEDAMQQYIDLMKKLQEQYK